MEPNTTSTEYVQESQAQYTQASTAMGGEMTVSLSSHSPYLPTSHLQGLGNPSVTQLGSLSNAGLAPNHSSLPPHSTFQLDLHPGTPLTQSEQQQLSMLWFSTSSLRPHQGSLSGLSGLAALPPDLQHCRPSAVSPDHVPSTQDILTPTSDSLIQVSVALPSYHTSLRNLVGSDDQVHGNSLAAMGNHRLDPGVSSISSLDSSQSAQIHRSDLLSHNDISLSTLEAVRAISTIYSIAPSQGANSDVTASVNSSHGAIGTNEDASGANGLHQTEYCNIDDLNAAAAAAAAHIPLKSEMISIVDSNGHVSGLGLDGISPHHLQAELVYRNHDGLEMSRSGTIQIPFLRSEDLLKGDKVDELPLLTLPKKFLEHTDPVSMHHDGLVDRMEQCATELMNKDVSQPTGEKLDGLTETVACFKCRLCPFISLNKKGVHQHLRDQHADAFVSSEDSEVEADVDISQSIVSQESVSQEQETIVEPSESDVANCKDAKVVMHPTAKGRKFICGKCQKGFPTLHPCRTHMMLDHGLRFDKVRLEKLSDQQPVREKKSPSSPTSKKRPRGRPRKGPNEIGKENTSRKDKALGARRKQKLPRKMKSLDDSSSDNEPLQKKKVRAKQEPKASANLSGIYNVGNGSAATDSDSRTNIPKISSPLKRRGRPKGSKNTGITALKRKNPKLKIDEELGYRCEVDGCAIRMKSIDNLEYHRRCHIPAATAFTCPECHEKFDHWRNISVHLWRSHVIDMELFACDLCSYKTYSYSKLMNMHKRIHSEERPFLCDTCGKGFKTSKQLRNHKVIHLDKRRHRSYRSGECDICHRFFSDKRMLRVHKDTVHNKLRPFLCNYCGYAASCRSTLKMHMRQHTGEKPFSCELCPYRTADHNSLRRHKMRHSGVKPYKCPFCTYACIQSSTYKTHLKNKHPGQDEGLMYSCNLCAFRTIKKDNFVTHMADHKAGTIPVSEEHGTSQIITTTPTKNNTVAVNPEHTVLVQTTQAIPHLAQLDTIPGNMTAAQVMFSTIEDIRQKIAIAAQSYPLEVGPTDRYPILLGQLKGSHLENTTVVQIDPIQTLDPSQLTHQEFLVHEPMTQEQVQQLTHAEVIQQHEQTE